MSIYSYRNYEAGEVLTLVGLGFFLQASNRTSRGNLKDVRVKCSFCRREFMYGPRYAEFMPYSTSDRRTARLVWRHSVLSPTCPTAIGLNGDNRPLKPSELNNYMNKHYVRALTRDCYPTISRFLEEPLLYRDPHQFAHQMIPTGRLVQRGILPVSGSLVTTSESLRNRCRYGEAGIRADIPDRDDDLYYHYRAEFEVEPYAEFNALECCWSEYSNLDAYQPRLEMLDYMTSLKPARKDMWQLEKREQTFVDLSWSAHVNFTSPSFDKIAEAGFYYTGEADCVSCFWCSLGLNCWDPGDDPWREHARFSPRCPWLLRCRGRYYVRKAILQSVTPAAVEPDKLLILTSWDDIHGNF